MRRRIHQILIVGGVVAALAACGQSQGQQGGSVGYGPNPVLPAPQRALIPTVKVSEVVGWPAGGSARACCAAGSMPSATA